MTFIKRMLSSHGSKAYPFVIIGGLLGLTSCFSNQEISPLFFTTSVTGEWIVELDNSTMLNPQTSGLSYANGHLFSISDGSADSSQIQRLHKLAVNGHTVLEKYGPIKIAENLMTSCFVSYLSTRPDYEALVVVPNTVNTWLAVTEDATRAGNISPSCQSKFANTGSTSYPTLIVQIELVEGELLLTGVRAIQFSKGFGLANFPNDGIEGLAITRDGRVLLGLEKDAKNQARVFEFSFNETIFDVLDSFLTVADSQLRIPQFTQGNHPINGLDVYYPSFNSTGFLIAAARNDHQLWIIDLAKQRPTTIIDIEFYAPSNTESGCAPTHKIKNTAIEGVAVHNNTVYLINDPWKEVYKDNAICAQDMKRYERMSPLLFNLPIDLAWFGL